MTTNFWKRMTFWKRDRWFEYKNLIESNADKAVGLFLDLVMAAPPAPADWPEWPEPDGVEFYDRYEESPEPIALHHASFAIEWAKAVERVLRDEEQENHREIMKWIRQHEHDPEFYYVFHLPNGRRLEYLEVIEARRDMHQRGHHLEMPRRARRRAMRRVLRKFRGS